MFTLVVNFKRDPKLFGGSKRGFLIKLSNNFRISGTHKDRKLNFTSSPTLVFIAAYVFLLSFPLSLLILISYPSLSSFLSPSFYRIPFSTPLKSPLSATFTVLQPNLPTRTLILSREFYFTQNVTCSSPGHSSI